MFQGLCNYVIPGCLRLGFEVWGDAVYSPTKGLRDIMSHCCFEAIVDKDDEDVMQVGSGKG